VDQVKSSGRSEVTIIVRYGKTRADHRPRRNQCGRDKKETSRRFRKTTAGDINVNIAKWTVNPQRESLSSRWRWIGKAHSIAA
jgi:hypothetical protein